jgi:Zn-dependent protease
LHADRLKQLIWQAEQAEQENRLSEALALLRQALDLLPPQTRQYEAIRGKITDLGRQVDGLTPADSHSSSVVQEHRSFWGRNGGKAGILGLLVVLLSKFKLLLLGLAKLPTLLSMLLFFGVYWNVWGWQFALGFVISLYIHEMGHVSALSRYGYKATAPVFIPGFGALVLLKQRLTNPREDSRMGLAGPLWGMGAAIASYALFKATGIMVLAAIAQIGAWINLFNLLPVWQLDGSRGFRSLATWQRWVLLMVMGMMLYLTGEKLLMIVMLFGVFQAFRKDAPAESDPGGLAEFAFLVVVLSVMCKIPVPTPTN